MVRIGISASPSGRSRGLAVTRVGPSRRKEIAFAHHPARWLNSGSTSPSTRPKAEAGAKRVGGALDRTTKNADRLRATLVRAFAVLGGAAALGGAVRTIAQFEQAMSTVGAVTGATAKQFETLNTLAQDLGARTRFSATQAAEGMTFLARAGFDVNEVMASIEGTLRLAQAGAIDLGTAADIASNVLTGFRLEVSETARVVDVLAKAANSSNTNIQQLGDGFKLVGPIAAGVGTEFEEVIASLGALADAGLQGTLGGTGLRRVISELESPATKTLEILGSLGLSSEQYRISTVGLVGALEALAKAGVDTGQALEIFGDRGGPAFEVLSSSIPRVKELAQALRDAGGTAEQIARLMDDNLNGALLRVRSAYEAVVLAFGQEGGSSVLRTGLEGLADILRAVARNIGSCHRCRYGPGPHPCGTEAGRDCGRACRRRGGRDRSGARALSRARGRPASPPGACYRVCDRGRLVCDR